MATRWKLAEVMARHQVKGIELALEMSVGTDTVSKWKRSPPPVTPERLDAIADAITKHSRIGGSVKGLDLFEESNNV